MISEILKRIKHKNYIPIVILINDNSYYFPQSWVEESAQLSSSVQYPSKKDDALLILSTERRISLSIQIPMDQIFHKSYYNICKQAIKSATLSCVTTKSYRNDTEVEESQKISVLDSLSYKYPVKQGKSESLSDMNMNSPFMDSSLTDSSSNNMANSSLYQKAHSINVQANNSQISNAYSKEKVNFSDVHLPQWIPMSCGVFGYSVQSLSCVLTSFSIKAQPENSMETWSIEFVEFHWQNQDEDLSISEKLEETPIDMIENNTDIPALETSYPSPVYEKLVFSKAV